MKKLLIAFAALLILALAGCGAVPADENGETLMGILNRNGITEEEFSQTGAAAGDSYTYRFYDDLSSMLLALDKGDVSGIFVPRSNADYILASAPGSYRTAPFIGQVFQSMAVAEDNTALLELLDNAIKALKKDGVLQELKSEYLDNCDPAAMPEPAELPLIEGADTVRVVITGDQPPMDYMTPEGKAAGYNIALLSAISRQAQINFETVPANSANRTLLINSGKADAIFCCSSYENGEAVAYYDLAPGMALTTPYLQTDSAYVYLKQE